MRFPCRVGSARRAIEESAQSSLLVQEFFDGLVVVKKILWAAGEIGQGRIQIDPAHIVDRCHYVLVTHRSGLGAFAAGVGFADNLAGLQATTEKHSTPGVGPMFAARTGV